MESCRCIGGAGAGGRVVLIAETILAIPHNLYSRLIVKPGFGSKAPESAIHGDLGVGHVRIHTNSGIKYGRDDSLLGAAGTSACFRMQHANSEYKSSEALNYAHIKWTSNFDRIQTEPHFLNHLPHGISLHNLKNATL